MKWDESEHPRDKEGKFTDGSAGARSKEDRLRELEYKFNSDSELGQSEVTRHLASFDFFSNRKRSKNNSENISPKPPEDVYGFASKERLNTEHHVLHAKDMGYKGQKEYQAAAIDFWKNGEGKMYYGAYRDRFYKYNANSEILLSVSSDGIIHTFMYIKKKQFEARYFKWEGLYEL